MAEQLYGTNFKPAKGTAYMAGKDRRADRRDAEQKVMQACLARDGRKCRWPGCTGKYRGLPLPIDPAHQIHRGMGGDKSLSRTTLETLVALCRRHHQEWDGDLIDLQPATDAGFNGPAAYYQRNTETGEWQHVATETARGISEQRR